MIYELTESPLTNFSAVTQPVTLFSSCCHFTNAKENSCVGNFFGVMWLRTVLITTVLCVMGDTFWPISFNLGHLGLGGE